MAALAAAVVTVPLWRERQSRVIAGSRRRRSSSAAAAGLYPLWSNWDWHAPAQLQAAAAPDVSAMVAKLEQHLRDDPNDLAGWLMLGRSYVALERLDDAILAYDHAHQLDAGNAEAALGLAEAMSLRAGGNITPEAAKLFEQALGLAPDNPKALLYGGFAAADARRSTRPRARAGRRSRICIPRPRSSKCSTPASRSWDSPRRGRVRRYQRRSRCGRQGVARGDERARRGSRAALSI